MGKNHQSGALRLLVRLDGTLGGSLLWAAESVDFNRDVRPILSNRCLKCHGQDEASRKGGLRLDVPPAALGGGKSGETSIKPGRPDESALIRRIFTAERMISHRL